jgi:hypothetical protein
MLHNSFPHNPGEIFATLTHPERDSTHQQVLAAPLPQLSFSTGLIPEVVIFP